MASTFPVLTSFIYFHSFISLLFIHLHVSYAQTPPIVSGLSYDFYNTSCPQFESIVRNQLQTEFNADIGQAAGLLRLHFHDCFVQSGGPNYSVPFGRRDGLTFATRNETIANLPAPTANASAILASLANKNFDPTDVIALSGSHTIGLGHCSSFTQRLYPTQDPTLNQTFANDLRLTCPTNTTDNTTNLDIRTPNVFDNRYYVNLMNRQGLFTSDQDLFTNSRTQSIVTSFANNQSLFYEKFVNAMIKMGQLSVLTGTNGEIRGNCTATNSNSSVLTTVVEEASEGLFGF